ncbi:Transcription factor MYB26 [Senna tora]|uniref:Transcription factor MYB26 n=1 Tax=Senna tora TaxID=362788 RepID=A0A834WQM7_9FABA|nr:Transcription factor MYB26 [Senna tora]
MSEAQSEEVLWVTILAAINKRLREGFGPLRKMRNSSDTLPLMDMAAGVKSQRKLGFKGVVRVVG